MNGKVSALNGIGLEVPDLQVGRDFYAAVGLECTDHDSHSGFRCRGRNSEEIVLIPAQEKRLHHISFSIANGGLTELKERVAAAKLEIASDPSFQKLRKGFWFRDPWGTWMNVTEEGGEDEPHVDIPKFNFGGKKERIDINLWQKLEKMQQPRPQKLGHILIFTPDWAGTEKFFTEVLGLWVTDRIAGKATFMTAGAGVVDHHCLAILGSTHRGLQHASFYVPTFDDIGYAAWSLREAGHKTLFGPGRHAIASNLFVYCRDPWGSWVEYYSDMDQVTHDWIAKDWNNLPYTWGPEWDPEFWTNQMNGNLEPLL